MKTRLGTLLFFLTLCPAAMASTVTVVISGLGGNADYTEQFERYANSIADDARAIATSPQDVILVQGDAAKRNVITDILENLPVSNNADLFRLYLVGHGSHDGETYKFNIPGPDITGDEIVAALANIQSPQQLVVVATSASGALLEPLAAKNRVVITATKNAREKNAVRFPQHMVEALSEPAADINKDESISAQEMFDYAERAVAGYYNTEKLLASEHPKIEGSISSEIEVARYGTLLQRKDSIAPELLASRQTLSAEINALRARKDDVDEDTYFDQLQSLMLELAEIQRSIDEGETTNADQ